MCYARLPEKGFAFESNREKLFFSIKNDVIIFERRRKKRNADFSCGVENTHENKRARYDRSAIILFFRIHGFTIKKGGGCPPSFFFVGVLRLGRNETKNEGRRIKEVNTTATSQVGGCGAAYSTSYSSGLFNILFTGIPLLQDLAKGKAYIS